MLEKLRIGRLSGSIKTRNAAELAREKKVSTIGVTVLFLDDTINTFVIDVSWPFLSGTKANWAQTKIVLLFLQKRAKGGDLLSQVFEHLELYEKDYFGLQYTQQPGDVVVRTNGFIVVILLTFRGFVFFSFSDGWTQTNHCENNGIALKAIPIHPFYLELRYVIQKWNDSSIHPHAINSRFSFM